MIRDPDAFWRFAVLIEYINRDAAAGVPISSDAQPLGTSGGENTFTDLYRAVFMEGAVVAERPKKKL